uniref:Uncharacterized protein n=1 Tax=Bionectria ochroleuca TaxID=29856 RepID=A0A0B7JZ72_BIOOC
MRAVDKQDIRILTCTKDSQPEKRGVESTGPGSSSSQAEKTPAMAGIMGGCEAKQAHNWQSAQ